MGVGHRRYRCSKQELDWFYDEVMSREVDLQLYADQASVPQQVMSRLNVVLHADIVRAAVAIQTWWRCVVPWRQYQRLYRAVVTIQGGGRGCADLLRRGEELDGVRLVVSGHIHGAHGVQRAVRSRDGREVRFVNAANALNHGEMAHKAVVLDI